MQELQFDYLVPELTEEEDAEILAAMAGGIEQLDSGQGIPVEELRREFFNRCTK